MLRTDLTSYTCELRSVQRERLDWECSRLYQDKHLTLIVYSELMDHPDPKQVVSALVVNDLITVCVSLSVLGDYGSVSNLFESLVGSPLGVLIHIVKIEGRRSVSVSRSRIARTFLKRVIFGTRVQRQSFFRSSTCFDKLRICREIRLSRGKKEIKTFISQSDGHRTTKTRSSSVTSLHKD